MKKIIIDISYLLYAPYKSCISLIQDKRQSLSILLLSFFSLTLCILSYYIALFKIFFGRSNIEIFGINALFFLLFFGLLIFFEVLINHFFLMKETSFGLSNVFLIVGASYSPYVFLSAISTFKISIFFNLLIYLIFFSWSLNIKYNIIKYFKSHFSANPWFITITPLIFEFTFFVVIVGVIGMTLISTVMSFLYSYGL